VSTAPPARPADAGFTLPEVMIAGALSLVLVLPGYVLLRRTYEVSDLLGSRFRLNEQARQAFSMLGDGSAATGVSSGGKSARGFGLVEGLRSRCGTYRTSGQPRCTAPVPSASDLRSASQLVLSDGDLSLRGDSISAMAVTCQGLRDPLPDCTGTESRTVQGWLGSDPSLSTSGRVRMLGITVTDPFRARRVGRLPAGATERYRTMFTLNAETDP
jgi:hypothetical protein